MNVSNLIDTALDRSIALGYGTIGLAVRRRLPGWPADPPRMDGKVALVTGAASGLGLATCQGFARLGATVLPVARSDARAEEAKSEILAVVPGAEVRPLVCDVSRLEALRGLADTVTRTEPRLDVLVNNAGAMPGERTETSDGVELDVRHPRPCPVRAHLSIAGTADAERPVIRDQRQLGWHVQPATARRRSAIGAGRPTARPRSTRARSASRS